MGDEKKTEKLKEEEEDEETEEQEYDETKTSKREERNITKRIHVAKAGFFCLFRRIIMALTA